MLLALILRLITEIIYIYIFGPSIIIHAVTIVLLNATYSYAIYEIYSVDDDNLPKASRKQLATNLKPWIWDDKIVLPEKV